MEITSPNRWRALIEMAAGAGVTCFAIILLFFFTDLGDDFSDSVKIGFPLACWMLVMWFFIAHSSTDRKSVNFKVW